MERRINKKPKNIQIKTRQDGDNEVKVIIGYGAVFYRAGDSGTEYELFDGVKERISTEAFDRALQDKDDVRGLFNHNVDNLLGRTSADTMRLKKDNTGLQFEIDIDENDTDHQRVVAKIERGDLTGSSFSFVPEKVVWIDDEENDEEIRIIESVRLFDVGPVSFPAYEGTSADLRSIDGDNKNVKQELEAHRHRHEGLKKRARAKTIELERDGYTQ